MGKIILLLCFMILVYIVTTSQNVKTKNLKKPIGGPYCAIHYPAPQTYLHWCPLNVVEVLLCFSGMSVPTAIKDQPLSECFRGFTRCFF